MANLGSIDAAGSRFAIGQRAVVRTEIARSSAWRTVAPLALLIPILLVLIALLVGRMLQPLEAAAASLDRRTEQDLVGIDVNALPVEIRPFVAAINGRLARVAMAMEHQRRFIADAAHELRTPMTALALQAESAAQAQTTEETHARVAVMRTGLRRTRELLDQLLNLARAQMAEKSPMVSVAIRPTLSAVLEELIPFAQAKNIDLGVAGDLSTKVVASELDLRMMVRNLVENAVRYIPRNGRIELSEEVRGGIVSLHVDDSGPGIDAANRARVFDAFYRIVGSGETGSGLGLSIVRALAERSGARVELSESLLERTRGLRASIIFATPATRSAPT